jgi:hypothetical protein
MRKRRRRKRMHMEAFAKRGTSLYRVRMRSPFSPSLRFKHRTRYKNDATNRSTINTFRCTRSEFIIGIVISAARSNYQNIVSPSDTLI